MPPYSRLSTILSALPAQRRGGCDPGDEARRLKKPWTSSSAAPAAAMGAAGGGPAGGGAGGLTEAELELFKREGFILIRAAATPEQVGLYPIVTS
jgi:hypothetical protein